MARDAHHEDAKEQRRDDDLDEPQKNGSEELQVHRDRGPVVAKLRARQQAHQDPGGQRAPRCRVGGDKHDRQPAQERRGERRQRHDLRAGPVSADKERRGNRNRGREYRRCQQAVFHRGSVQERIGGERYAASGRVSMQT